jgi:hypothetical protein
MRLVPRSVIAIQAGLLTPWQQFGLQMAQMPIR